MKCQPAPLGDLEIKGIHLEILCLVSIESSESLSGKAWMGLLYA